MKKTLLIAAAVTAISAAPSYASVKISGSQIGSTASYAAPKGSTSVITFNTDSLRTEAKTLGFSVQAVGNAAQSAASQFPVAGTRDDFLRPEPSDNSAFFGVGANSSLTLLGTIAQQSVSVFIGSIDAYNVVTLLDRTGNAIKSFDGVEMLGFIPAFPGTTDPNTNRRITFTADAGTAFHGISFSNKDGKGSFEFDNVAFTAAIPEPATWAMMLLGFGMVGAAARYRRRATSLRLA